MQNGDDRGASAEAGIGDDDRSDGGEGPAQRRDAMGASRRELRDAVKRLGYVQGERIVSARGGRQNWMFDLRRVFLDREALASITRQAWDRLEGRSDFQMAALETAAIPLLTSMLIAAPERSAGVGGLIIRKDRKTTGLCRAIEGTPNALPVVLVDDVVNSGTSLEKARVVLEDGGLTIAAVLVVIDYRSPRGMAWRAQHGIEVLSLFTLDDFDLRLRSPPPPPPQRYAISWKASVPGANAFHVVPKSAPIRIGSRLYRGSDKGRMMAFDADTGEEVWSYAVTAVSDRKGIWSTPSVHAGRLYFGAYNGCVYCLDAGDGSLVWKQSYGEWIGSSPLVVPGHKRLYIGIEYERPWAKGSLTALDLDTGEKVWEHQVSRLQHGSAAYFAREDLVIWGSADHETVGLDAKSGEAVWRFPTERSVKYAPAVDEDRGLVAFASFDKHIYLLEAATGKFVAKWKTGEICYTTPLFAGGKLFCGSGDRKMYVIDLSTLALAKVLDVGARAYSSPTLVNDSVIFGTNGGKLIELDIDTLDVRGTLQLPDAITNAVAASDDGSTLYVSTYMNSLYAIERLSSSEASKDPR